MTISLLATTTAFIWLMIETKWLTIRLPRYVNPLTSPKEWREVTPPALVLLALFVSTLISGIKAYTYLLNEDRLISDIRITLHHIADWEYWASV